MTLEVGMRVRTRKKHPCGSDQWQIIRVGADIRIKCTGCGHMVLIPRVKFEKMVKEILSIC